MGVWDQIVDVLRESMLAYAQVCNGNLGYGILIVTFLIVTFLARVAILPLTLRLARAAQMQQRGMQRIQPVLDALRRRHKDNPCRLAEETRRLLAREGVSALPVAGCVGGLVQLPVFLALYTAVRDVSAIGGRFLWVRDLARPDSHRGPGDRIGARMIMTTAELPWEIR